MQNKVIRNSKTYFNVTGKLFTIKMFKFLSRFEDPNWPFLGPNLWGLQTLKMWDPNGYVITMSLFHIVPGLFVFSQIFELWNVRRDKETVIQNLSHSLLAMICFVKAVTFLIWQKHWNNIIVFVSNFDKHQRSRRNKIIVNVIKEYTEYTRIVDHLYFTLAIMTVIFIMIAPLLVHLLFADKNVYPEIMSAWFPFDKSKGFWCCTNYLLQALILVWGGGIVWSYDSTAISLMCFFTGQLKILKVQCELIFGDGTTAVDDEEAMERIRSCHDCQMSLIKYCKKFNSLLSPVLFLYVVVCSLMICASTILLTTEVTSSFQQMCIAEYITALVFQLFFYCWHSNEVTRMSQEMNYGVFASLWYKRDVRMRRCAFLLGGGFRKVVFTAGPFTTLGVPTFVNILKGSYSYYTLLSK